MFCLSQTKRRKLCEMYEHTLQKMIFRHDSQCITTYREKLQAMTQQTVNKEVTAFVGRYITPRNHLKDQLYIDNLTTRLLVNITEELEESEIPCIENHGIDYVELKRLYDGHEEETITPEAFAEECDMCSTIHVAIYSAVVRTMDVPEILHGDKFNDIVSDCFRYCHLTEALIVACVKDQADSRGVPPPPKKKVIIKKPAAKKQA